MPLPSICGRCCRVAPSCAVLCSAGPGTILAKVHPSPLTQPQAASRKHYRRNPLSMSEIFSARLQLRALLYFRATAAPTPRGVAGQPVRPLAWAAVAQRQPAGDVAPERRRALRLIFSQLSVVILGQSARRGTEVGHMPACCLPAPCSSSQQMFAITDPEKRSAEHHQRVAGSRTVVWWFRLSTITAAAASVFACWFSQKFIQRRATSCCGWPTAQLLCCRFEFRNSLFHSLAPRTRGRTERPRHGCQPTTLPFLRLAAEKLRANLVRSAPPHCHRRAHNQLADSIETSRNSFEVAAAANWPKSAPADHKAI